MQHTESSITKVYETKEYSRFLFINGNRAINDSKLKKIIAEIDNDNDMLRYYPIQVREQNNKLMILDGQHRFYLSKFYQRHVYYIIVKEEKTMGEIARVNSNVEKWKMNDFLNCYIKNGSKDYEVVRQFMEKTALGFSLALRLLATGSPGAEGVNTEINDSFKNGTFKVTHLEEAEEIASLCEEFEQSNIHTSKGFVIAIYRIHKAGKVTISELAAAYKKRPHLLTRQANYKAYVVNLEQIMNVLKQHRIVIL